MKDPHLFKMHCPPPCTYSTIIYACPSKKSYSLWIYSLSVDGYAADGLQHLPSPNDPHLVLMDPCLSSHPSVAVGGILVDSSPGMAAKLS
ncbi:hypothetical protein DSO57_1018147 [Entomophthora muscae]|uniref:Uncharacterized protein n=1 Tax=Entomophthora muscae TaxID=34485 RepID=A0ACC2STF7_9FUNG|nr:hypothetical protein DSO57_1018147 [Entomophthora muscae]